MACPGYDMNTLERHREETNKSHMRETLRISGAELAKPPIQRLDRQRLESFSNRLRPYASLVGLISTPPSAALFNWFLVSCVSHGGVY